MQGILSVAAITTKQKTNRFERWTTMNNTAKKEG